MIQRMHLVTILVAGALIWGTLLSIDGEAVSPWWLVHGSTVAGILLLLLTAFDLWLWKLPFLQGWFVQRPNVNGTWKAEIISSWTDPRTGKTSSPVEAYAVIRQTFSRLWFRLIVRDSHSEMLGAVMLRSEDGCYRIVGVYRNEPKAAVRGKDPIHYGGVMLEIAGEPPTHIQGTYWTDRNTHGDLVLTDKRKAVLDTFDLASKAFQAPQSPNLAAHGAPSSS